MLVLLITVVSAVSAAGRVAAQQPHPQIIVKVGKIWKEMRKTIGKKSVWDKDVVYEMAGGVNEFGKTVVGCEAKEI